MSRRFTKFCAAAVIALTGVAMLGASFDADARRMGGGGSFGRQSSNVMQQRQAVTPPAANTGANTARSAAAPAAAGAAAGAATRSGMSRFLGPIAGIAAGLGLAALLSSMGLSGALLEFLSSALLIGLVVFAIFFIVRRLRGASAGARPAMQGAGAGAGGQGGQQPAPMWRESAQPAAAPAAAPVAAAAPMAAAAAAAPVDTSWFIPADFDSHAFLQNAKAQFVAIQKLWDSGDVESLREYLTDDLLAELRPQIAANAGGQTSVVLLNAELLGVEQVSGGHLASVRFSGMLREEAGAEAFRFEEVWNLFKSEQGGWLLAGIQQMNVAQ
ncbi:Tim44 domain-containing protein [Kerstersia similis]|uniref:Tim44 domain-containing protein n=1 Tax=Kerstersia similis TaxID=206505 RepID=UPI0039EE6037